MSIKETIQKIIRSFDPEANVSPSEILNFVRAHVDIGDDLHLEALGFAHQDRSILLTLYIKNSPTPGSYIFITRGVSAATADLAIETLQVAICHYRSNPARFAPTK